MDRRDPLKDPNVGASGVPNVDDDLDDGWAATEFMPAAQAPTEDAPETAERPEPVAPPSSVIEEHTLRSKLAPSAVVVVPPAPPSSLPKLDAPDSQEDLEEEHTLLAEGAERVALRAPAEDDHPISSLADKLEPPSAQALPHESAGEDPTLLAGPKESPPARSPLASTGAAPPGAVPTIAFDDDDERLDPKQLFEGGARREETVLMPTAPRLLSGAAGPARDRTALAQGPAKAAPPEAPPAEPAPFRGTTGSRPQLSRPPIPFEPGKVKDRRDKAVPSTAFAVFAGLALVVFVGGLALFLLLR